MPSFVSQILIIVPTKYLLSSHTAQHTSNSPEESRRNHPTETSQHHNSVPYDQPEDCTGGSIKLLGSLWLLCHQNSVVFAHARMLSITLLRRRELLHIPHKVPNLVNSQAFAVRLADDLYSGHRRTSDPLRDPTE